MDGDGKDYWAAVFRGAAWALGFALAGGAGLYLAAHPPLVHYSADSKLDRTARALVAQESTRKGVILVRLQGAAVAVPAGLHFDRRQAVLAALAVAAALTEARSAPSAGAAEEVREQASARVAQFLALDDEQAWMVTCALGWPCPPAPDGRGGPEPGQAACADACRSAVERAFISDGGSAEARELLGKCASLAPPQATTVLAMAAALDLLQMADEALPALQRVARAHPDLARPILDAIGGKVPAPWRPSPRGG